MRIVCTVCVIAASLLSACGRGGGGGGSRVSAIINSPAEGDTVRGSAVHVTLAVTGIELAPAADERPGTAHHHLFLDVDIGPSDQKIPSGVPGIIHLGRAQTEHHWDSVAAGPHRIIAVLADWQHVPLASAATDTVRFVVQPQ
ncbi:MAG TPA: DUF4399 domain-containing protein [Gemmatimonadales bacterium]|nr:DUF4399 domain-containing protein [Gemmatimonadales bacterium]